MSLQRYQPGDIEATAAGSCGPNRSWARPMDSQGTGPGSQHSGMSFHRQYDVVEMRVMSVRTRGEQEG